MLLVWPQLQYNLHPCNHICRPRHPSIKEGSLGASQTARGLPLPRAESGPQAANDALSQEKKGGPSGVASSETIITVRDALSIIALLICSRIWSRSSWAFWRSAIQYCISNVFLHQVEAHSTSTRSSRKQYYWVCKCNCAMIRNASHHNSTAQYLALHPP